MDAEKIFLDYASHYDRGNPKVELKIVHTLKVAEIMDFLTGKLGLSEEEREIAHICAVFHDIGRFEQVRRYNTFFDFLSEDHAKLGVAVLKEENMLSELPPRVQQIVYTAIANHNQYEIEPGLDEEMMLYCKLIRDADKCDIFRVFATEDMVDTVGETMEQVRAEAISEESYQNFFRHQCVKRGKKQLGIDKCITILSFCFNMYYDESIEFVRKDKYYRYRFDHMAFTREETAHRAKEILDELETYLSMRLERLAKKRKGE